MPSKLDRCIDDVRKKIKSGKIPRTYPCGKKRCLTSEYAICSKVNKNEKKHKK